jgi:hypothetical protein
MTNNFDVYVVDDLKCDINNRLVESAKVARHGSGDTKLETLQRDEIISLLDAGCTIYIKRGTGSSKETLSSMPGGHSKLPLDDATFIKMVLYRHHVTGESLISTEEKILHDNLTATAFAPIR